MDSNPSLVTTSNVKTLLIVLLTVHTYIGTLVSELVWERETQTIQCSHYPSVNPSCSAKLTNTSNRPQLTCEKTSECRFFDLKSLEPGRLQNCSVSTAISFEGIAICLATKR